MSDKGTINEKTKLPLGFVVSIVGLAVLMSCQWMNLRATMATYHAENLQLYRDTLTQKQAQEWIDDARELNPTVKWPRIPAKNEPPSLSMQADAVLARKE